MSLVNDIITEVVDYTSDLSQVLRKATVLASELGSEDLRAWVEAELNGYEDQDALPAYRVSTGSNHGNFAGLAGRSGKGLPIPLSLLPESWRERMWKLKLRQGVAALLEMLRSETEYVEEWPADLVASVSDDIYQDMTMISARKDVPRARIAAVLDAVRNRLLNFLLELKAQHPEEVETGGAKLQSIPTDDVQVYVVNNIYGGANVVAIGETVQQLVQQGVKPGNLESLLSALREASLPDELVNELPEAIDEDESVRGGGVGPKVSRWLAKVGEKVATSTVAAVAAQAIFKYYEITGS